MPKIIDFVVIKMKRLISEDKSEEEVPEKVGVVSFVSYKFVIIMFFSETINPFG